MATECTTTDKITRSLTIFQPSPSCDHGHASREVVLVVRHADGHDVLVVVDRRLKLQKGYVVLESRRVVLPMDDDAFHVLADAPLGLDLAANVVLAEHGHQVRQKSAKETTKTRYNYYYYTMCVRFVGTI